MAKQIILNCPYFTKVFKIHTDVSDRQLGAIIAQEVKTLSSTQEKKVVLSAFVLQLNKNYSLL